MILPLDDLSVFLSHDLFPCSCLWYSIPWVSGIAWSCLRPPPSSLYLLIALRLFSLRWTSFVHFFCLTISLSTDASFFSFCCIPAQVVFSRLNLNSLIPKSLYFISTTECSLCLLRCLILWFPWYTILSLSPSFSLSLSSLASFLLSDFGRASSASLPDLLSFQGSFTKSGITKTDISLFQRALGVISQCNFNWKRNFKVRSLKSHRETEKSIEETQKCIERHQKPRHETRDVSREVETFHVKLEGVSVRGNTTVFCHRLLMSHCLSLIVVLLPKKGMQSEIVVLFPWKNRSSDEHILHEHRHLCPCDLSSKCNFHHEKAKKGEEIEVTVQIFIKLLHLCFTPGFSFLCTSSFVSLCLVCMKHQRIFLPSLPSLVSVFSCLCQCHVNFSLIPLTRDKWKRWEKRDETDKEKSTGCKTCQMT